MIKVLLWDIDGTLLDFLAAERISIRRCFETFSLGECTGEMLAQYSRINRIYWEKLENGEMSKPDILVGRFSEFFRQRGIDESLAPAFNEEYQNRLGDVACYHEHGEETVRKLKGQVLQCAVTNGTQTAQVRKLRASGLDAMLDHVFISEEVGHEKPSPAFFEKVFEAIGPYKKDEILIIGDSLTSDIRGGRLAGIRTCLYDPNHKAVITDIIPDMIIDDLATVAGLPDLQRTTTKG